ncbi:MAG TPA: hypothetical protein VHG88_04300 [Burkholderiales bacterium]|nr:hypothetical protein [Burkholderiales bacterium]
MAPLSVANNAYCDFFSGSCVAPDDEAPLGELLAPDELLLGELLGELLLGELPLLPDAPDGLELELAPPEAEPELDFEGSVALGELDELPPEGEVAEDEPEPELGGVDDAPPLVLPLVLPLLPVVLPVPLS